MITIREADLDKDAPMIMAGARDFASRTAFQSILPVNDSKFIEAISFIVSQDGFELLVAERESDIIGFIGIQYSAFQWNHDILIGEEKFWWTAKNAPYRTGYRLFEEAMKKIKTKGAVPFFRKLTTSPDGVDRLYRDAGMVPIESLWVGLT